MGQVGRSVFFILLVAFVAVPGVAGSGRPVCLFDSRDASQLSYGLDEWPRIRRSRSAGSGPTIRFQLPAIQELSEGPTLVLRSPAGLRVEFARTQADVDMGSLTVSARKGFFSKSLTEALRPYVRGTTVDVPELTVPSGRFIVDVAIADANGVQTTASYRLEVSEQ